MKLRKQYGFKGGFGYLKIFSNFVCPLFGWVVSERAVKSKEMLMVREI